MIPESCWTPMPGDKSIQELLTEAVVKSMAESWRTVRTTSIRPPPTTYENLTRVAAAFEYLTGVMDSPRGRAHLRKMFWWEVASLCPKWVDRQRFEQKCADNHDAQWHPCGGNMPAHGAVSHVLQYMDDELQLPAHAPPPGPWLARRSARTRNAR